MTTPERFELLLTGCGAIGSRFEAVFDDHDAAITFADNQLVLPENLGISAFRGTDLYREKAAILAIRRRKRNRIGRALCGDVRYTLRPGLAARLDAAVLCLDNPSALRDATEALWSAGSTILPVLAVACGGEEGGHQVRFFMRPGPCPVCFFGNAERRADRLALGASCVDTTAPRAAANAAEAAARAAAALLKRWRAGDYSFTNCRIQRDRYTGKEYVIRMPGDVSPRCPVPHGARDEANEPVEELGGRIASLTVGDLAERALARTGDDAEILLGRRAVPLGGRYCPRCRVVSAAPLMLVPKALRFERTCDCAEPLRPLGERSTVGARELLGPRVASLCLADWGAGHGDEFIAMGSRGRVRLRCSFEWRDLDER